MKEDGKLIKIDPQLFSFSSSKNKTNKKQNSTPSGSIRIKTKPKQKKDTLKKQSLLKMIRHHQEDKYKQLFDKKTINNVKPKSETQKFNTSFEDSKNYLANLMTEQDNTVTPIPKNKTLKDRTNLLNNTTSNSSFKLDLSNINNTTNTNTQMPIITLEPNVELVGESNNNPIFDANQKPEYGCLKGGALPTYRNLFNKTKKQINNIFGSGPPPSSSDIKTRELIEKHHKKQNNYGSIHRRNKQKRIQRRTYKTGKSSKIPKITVLVSNKTIRNNTNLRMLKIKELPILQVKKELIKRGLIRVGTITPNDLLRKMYETVEMLCGDVQNYNSDNLLYNFINDK